MEKRKSNEKTSKKRHRNIKSKSRSKQKNKVGPVCFEMKGNEMKQNITITMSTINKDCIYRK